MNTKTTLLLAMALAVLGGLYYVSKTRPASADSDVRPLQAVGASATRDLLETKLGDVVKVVVRKAEQDEWVFDKDEDDGGVKTWRMTAPIETDVPSWEADKFGRQLGGLQYDVSYGPGSSGLTAAQAGLDPPWAVVTLTDAEGQSATIELGKSASHRETYVRLSGSDEICVGKADLRSLIKDSVLDYREKQLWNFSKEHVTRLEIIDRSDAAGATKYKLVRDGSNWKMESPVSARATGKVDELLTSMGRLRAMAWHDDNVSKLGMYGLEPATWTIHASVEQLMPIAKPAGDEAVGGDDKPKLEMKYFDYELHLSQLSPIGEDSKVYCRVGDEPFVATISSINADKFKPTLAEWRDMHVTTVDVQLADRIEVNGDGTSATLVKKDGAWFFDGDGGRAELSAVTELLTAVENLSAVAYVDDASSDLSTQGLDTPRASVALSIPGLDHVERIVVGSVTDAATKRLVYVRRNDLASVAKVRATDVGMLLRGVHAYRDRTIIEALPSQFRRISLSADLDGDATMNQITLAHADSSWGMVEPVTADVRADHVDKLVETLGNLRADEVVTDAGEASAYGLHAPSATLRLTYEPLNADTADAASKLKTIELGVTQHDGKYYAKRSDRPTIYAVGKSLHDLLTAEYRTDRIVDFDETNVARFTIRRENETHTFVKQEDKWVYAAEPDLPLDQAKVANLLLQIKDLRTPRYVVHTEGDLASYDLADPFRTVAVEQADGTSQVLWVSSTTSELGPDKGFYAAVQGRGDVFLFAADSVARITVSLDELEP